jgi:hypothetical protein
MRSLGLLREIGNVTLAFVLHRVLRTVLSMDFSEGTGIAAT